MSELLSWSDLKEGMLVDIALAELPRANGTSEELWIPAIVDKVERKRIEVIKHVPGHGTWRLDLERGQRGGFIAFKGQKSLNIRRTDIGRLRGA